MIPENKALLAIGSLYWIGLFVVVAGFAAEKFTENSAIGSGGMAAGVALWVAALVIGLRGKDRFGKVRTGIDRGR